MVLISTLVPLGTRPCKIFSLSLILSLLFCIPKQNRSNSSCQVQLQRGVIDTSSSSFYQQNSMMIIWSKYPCIDALGFSRRATACPALAFRTTSISVCRLQRGIRIAVRGAAARRASTCDGRTRIFIPTLLGPLGSLRFTNTPRAFSALHLHDFKQPAFALEI